MLKPPATWTCQPALLSALPALRITLMTPPLLPGKGGYVDHNPRLES